jgi:hypothetical protein
MRAISIDAKNLDSARRLHCALMEFHPEVTGSEEDGYCVAVELGSNDDRTVALLDAIQQYDVTEPQRYSGIPARRLLQTTHQPGTV